MGCGYGWHCKFAEEQGATKILGIDLSKKMIEEAQKRNSGNQIEYRISGLEEYDYPENEWDCVISNLALHYIEDIVEIFQKVYRTLKPGGIFLFNIEHPVFTAGVGQDWIYTDDGKPQYWLGSISLSRSRVALFTSPVALSVNRASSPLPNPPFLPAMSSFLYCRCCSSISLASSS